MKLVILAGGNGTRLFPLSRTCRPKQFLRLAGEHSLLQQTIERFHGLVSFEDMLIVTNGSYVFQVKDDLAELGAEAVSIIAEPVGRNTAPSIALAMAYLRDNLACAENECIFVTPADHVIKPATAFAGVVLSVADIAEAGEAIVTVGVKPDHPETGYGYIQATEHKCGVGYYAKGFKEKPDLKTAEAYLKSGAYYWNAGMFAFTRAVMTQVLEKHAPDIGALLKLGYEELVSSFASMPSISIDYAVAEHWQPMIVVPMEGVYWNDIGSFDALEELLCANKGNFVEGNVLLQDCSNTMVLGENRLISAIGVKDLIIVDTPDALLLSRKGRSQEVKQVVEQLQ